MKLIYHSAIKNHKKIVFKGVFEKETHCILINKNKKNLKLREIKERFNKIPNDKFTLKLNCLIKEINKNKSN